MTAVSYGHHHHVASRGRLGLDNQGEDISGDDDIEDDPARSSRAWATAETARSRPAPLTAAAARKYSLDAAAAASVSAWLDSGSGETATAGRRYSEEEFGGEASLVGTRWDQATAAGGGAGGRNAAPASASAAVPRLTKIADFGTKATPVLCVRFTPRNLLLGAGALTLGRG